MTKTEYVYPPAAYLLPTPHPTAVWKDNYSLAIAYKDLDGAFAKCNADKADIKKFGLDFQTKQQK